jgi:hypothetical protein
MCPCMQPPANAVIYVHLNLYKLQNWDYTAVDQLFISEPPLISAKVFPGWKLYRIKAVAMNVLI